MSYPIFKEHGQSCYKMISDNEYVEVQNDNCLGGPSIGFFKVPDNYARIVREGEEIPENVFIDAYVKAIHALQMVVHPEVLELELDHQLSPGLPTL